MSEKFYKNLIEGGFPNNVETKSRSMEKASKILKGRPAEEMDKILQNVDIKKL